jgi:hypothetical protein
MSECFSKKELMMRSCFTLLVPFLTVVFAVAQESNPDKTATSHIGVLIRGRNEGQYQLRAPRGRYVLMLPTKGENPKTDPLDPKIVQFCQDNIGKRVLVNHKEGYHTMGQLRALLVTSMSAETKEPEQIPPPRK